MRTIYHVLPRDENQCVICWQEKVVIPPPTPSARPRQKLNIFQLSVDAPRGGSVHASGTLPGVNTSSYNRRLNFCGRVVSKKVVPLGKSRNRCERPLMLYTYTALAPQGLIRRLLFTIYQLIENEQSNPRQLILNRHHEAWYRMILIIMKNDLILLM